MLFILYLFEISAIARAGNFQAIADAVDMEHYREECVDFTAGWVSLVEAQQNTALFVGITFG